jgi:hypothetical protein
MSPGSLATNAELTHLKIDFSYVYVEYELWALGHMLGVIEPTIEFLAQQNEAELVADLEARGWIHDDAERQFVYQDIAEVRDYVLPRFMRGPFVVALWASFESTVRQVAWARSAEIGVSSRFKVGRGSFLARASGYFERRLALPLDLDAERYARLVDLYAVRNALAHANGLKDGMSAQEWRQLSQVGIRRGAPVDEWHDMLVLPHDFVERAYADVSGCVRDLVTRARAARDLVMAGGSPATP